MLRPAVREMRMLDNNSGHRWVCDKTLENYEHVEKATVSHFHTLLLSQQTDFGTLTIAIRILAGAEIRCVIYCDKVKTTMRSLNLSERGTVAAMRCEETDHLWSITFYVKRGCGEIPRDLLKSVTLTWQPRDNRFQLPLNITGALSRSHEEDHFADSPVLLWPGVRDPDTDIGQSEKRIVVEFLRTLIKKLWTMTRVSFIEKWLQIWKMTQVIN